MSCVYRLNHFQCDLIAGLTVGLTVIPQGLAYAVVAGLQPQVRAVISKTGAHSTKCQAAYHLTPVCLSLSLPFVMKGLLAFVGYLLSFDKVPEIRKSSGID